MDRQNYGLRQKVTHTDLNALQTNAEAGMEAAVADIQLSSGVITGLAVSPAGGNKVTVSAGRGRDTGGARVKLLADIPVDLAAQLPTTSGQERWVSVLAYRDRTDSDKRLDGDNLEYYFVATETVEVRLVAGTAAATGSSARPARPADGGILLADVLVKYGQAAVVAGDISTTRRELWSSGKAREFLDAGGNFRSGGTAGGTEAYSVAITNSNGAVGRADTLKDGGGTYRSATAPGAATANSVAVTDSNGAVGRANAIQVTGSTYTTLGTAGGVEASRVPYTDANGAVGRANALQVSGTTYATPTTAGGVEASRLALTNASGRVGDSEKLGGVAAASWQRLDQAVTRTASMTMGAGTKLTLAAMPVDNLEAATKSYVDQNFDAIRIIRLDMIDLAIQVETMKQAQLTGVNANMYVEAFNDQTDLYLIKGSYDATNRKVYLK